MQRQALKSRNCRPELGNARHEINRQEIEQRKTNRVEEQSEPIQTNWNANALREK
jgi:hypothetical protein